MPSSLLDDLPIELLIKVLCYLPFSGLHSAILASPQCYRIYSANRTQVLEPIVCRETGSHENLRIALAACAVPSQAFSGRNIVESFRSLGAGNRTEGPEIEEIEEALSAFQDRADFSIRGVSTLKQLGQLCQIVDHFVDELSNDAFSQLKATLNRPPPAANPESESLFEATHPLSETERTRVRRALFRLEHWRRIVTASMAVPGRDHARLNQAFEKVVWSPLKLWQLQEVGCIHALIFKQFELVFDMVEQEFIAGILARVAEEKLPAGLVEHRCRCHF